jgi:Flp pilus assembly protein TadG
VKRAGRNIRTDRRGAVIVEFVVAIMPMLMVFFSIAQLSALGYTSLLVKHAAFVAARAEAVIHPGMGDSGSESDVTAAANLVLARVPAGASVTSASAAPLSQNLDTTTVTVVVPCSVPLGNVLVCGVGRTHAMTAQASFPNQGSYIQTLWRM